jgi:CHASE3 domain sensor protein
MNPSQRERALEEALRAVEAKGNTTLAQSIRRALKELREAPDQGIPGGS